MSFIASSPSSTWSHIVLSCHTSLVFYNLEQFLSISSSFTMTFLKIQLACSLLLFQWHVSPLGFVVCFLVVRFRCCPMAGTLHKWCCVLLRVTSGGTQCPSLVMLVDPLVEVFLSLGVTENIPRGGNWEFASRWSLLCWELGTRRQVRPNVCS